MLVSEIKDLIKSLNIIDNVNYYCGTCDQKKEKSLGFYKEDSGNREVNINGYSLKINGKQIQILVHWNKNYDETEKAAFTIYNKLKEFNEYIIKNNGYEFNNYTIMLLDLIDNEPLDYQKDPITDTGVFQQGIRFRILYTKND